MNRVLLKKNVLSISNKNKQPFNVPFFWQSMRTSLCVNMTMPRPSFPPSICGRLCSLNVCNGGFLFLFCCFLLQHLPLTQGQGNGNGNVKIEGECGNMLRCSLSTWAQGACH